MRLSVRDLSFEAAAAPGRPRPIRLRVGGLTYCMSPSEAIDLATQLADAVTELKNSHTERTDHA
ncbi:hypothetical protein NIIDNTM18_49730 [Mycolicibacterium litorale]|uniref:Uncharacterized protein n=1 Tax=Mycolicibacterium litorale TaxID=758802 RepID=A0A6S6PB73_9MYCO|nr:hypothetical protein NIIDNTM18_49730 [Mycolicibacterium litorale]